MTKEQRDEMINKIKNMPEEEFLELYKSAFEYDDKYKDFDEYCECVKDGLNPGFCDEDCEECRQAWLNKKPDFTNHTGNAIDYPN